VSNQVCPSSFDLKALTGSVMYTSPGYYLSVLEVKNRCNGTPISRAALIQVAAAPMAATANFMLLDQNGQSTITPSPSLPGTNNCGLSLAINGSLSTGAIDWYSITIYQVDGITGVTIGAP
jgi:hypothetical protein